MTWGPGECDPVLTCSKFLTTSDFGDLLGVARSTVYRAIAREAVTHKSPNDQAPALFVEHAIPIAGR